MKDQILNIIAAIILDYEMPPNPTWSFEQKKWWFDMFQRSATPEDCYNFHCKYFEEYGAADAIILEQGRREFLAFVEKERPSKPIHHLAIRMRLFLYNNAIKHISPVLYN